MIIVYFFFGYRNQKWFNYEERGLIPFFTHGPLISPIRSRSYHSKEE
jgi:hypothetical protein